MKQQILFLCLGLFIVSNTNAQTTDAKAAAAAKKDSMILAKMNAKGTYPLIDASKFSGVMPVDGITAKPESTLKYKLLFNFTRGANDSTAKQANRGLAEIGRIINLHIAAGVPRENMEVVIVTHGKSLFSILTNDAFKKQFKVANPNLAILNELQLAGAQFIACGQAMQFLDIEKESLPPYVKIAMAAKVELSTYQLKGYAVFDINEE